MGGLAYGKRWRPPAPCLPHSRTNEVGVGPIFAARSLVRAPPSSSQTGSLTDEGNHARARCRATPSCWSAPLPSSPSCTPRSACAQLGGGGGTRPGGATRTGGGLDQRWWVPSLPLCVWAYTREWHSSRVARRGVTHEGRLRGHGSASPRAQPIRQTPHNLRDRACCSTRASSRACQPSQTVVLNRDGG